MNFNLHTSKKQALACQSATAGVNPSHFSKILWSVVLRITDAERILATVSWSLNTSNLKTCESIASVTNVCLTMKTFVSSTSNSSLAFSSVKTLVHLLART